MMKKEKSLQNFNWRRLSEYLEDIGINGRIILNLGYSKRL
jgi:hypothetical protein